LDEKDSLKGYKFVFHKDLQIPMFKGSKKSFNSFSILVLCFLHFFFNECLTRCHL